jgi:hypothetical protein
MSDHFDMPDHPYDDDQKQREDPYGAFSPSAR